MNKKLLVLTVLPALLLSGCGGEKQISAAEAKDVAAKMLEKEQSAEPVKEFGFVMSSKSTASSNASSNSAFVNAMGSVSLSNASTTVFQFSLEKNYLHYAKSSTASGQGLSSSGFMEEWLFVDGGSIYSFSYLSGSSGVTKTAMKRKLTEAEQKEWNFSLFVDLANYVKTATTTFNYTLAAVAAGEAEQEQPQEEGVKTTLSFFSAGEGNLHINSEAVYNGAEQSYAGFKGEAKGKSVADVYWENNLPKGYETSAEIDVSVADEDGTSVTVKTTEEASAYIQYSGILIEYPDASQYTIKDLDKVVEK